MFGKFDPLEVERMKEGQKRNLTDLRLTYESQLDEKERELVRLKEKSSK
jgi:hypothetical protein